MLYRFVATTMLAALSVRSVESRWQQSANLSHDMAQALVASAGYLHDEMLKGPPTGRVDLDARSLNRLVTDSAATLRPRMAQALGVGLADEARLDTCKPVRSVGCELGPARAVLEVRSVVVNGTHATVEIRKYEGRASPSGAQTLVSTILRFTLIGVDGAWSVTKYGVVNG